jgi:outer membrane protein assembly factor BamA
MSWPNSTASILLACLLSGAAPDAAAAPPVVEIRFEGNRHTRPVTMQRELLLREGDPADQGLIERSRQAIQDLGLFRSVEVLQESVPEGVRLVFTVVEKWYVLVYPRLTANSDGQNSYGAELRWNNLWGLNHSLRVLGRSRDARQDTVA